MNWVNPGPASIIRLESPNGIETVKWLCPSHVEAHTRSGWVIRDTKPAPHPLACQDCDRLHAAEDEEIAFT